MRTLEAIAALRPDVVVPGHMAVNDALCVSAVTYTRYYLLAFEEKVAKTGLSALGSENHVGSTPVPV